MTAAEQGSERVRETGGPAGRTDPPGLTEVERRAAVESRGGPYTAAGAGERSTSKAMPVRDGTGDGLTGQWGRETDGTHIWRSESRPDGSTTSFVRDFYGNPVQEVTSRPGYGSISCEYDARRMAPAGFSYFPGDETEVRAVS